MTGNGLTWAEQDKQDRFLRAAASLDPAVIALHEAAVAMRKAAQNMDAIRASVERVGSDTARALSDTAELKRHLKNITEREQVALRELNDLKRSMALMPGRIKRKIKAKAKRR